MEMGIFKAGSAASMLSFINRLQEAYWKGQNDFVSIHSRNWENSIADGIRTKIKDALKAADILETDGLYIPKEKSTGYGLLILFTKNMLFHFTTLILVLN